MEIKAIKNDSDCDQAMDRLEQMNMNQKDLAIFLPFTKQHAT